MKYEWLLPIAVAAALYSLYVNFAIDLVQSGIITKATSVEQGMFALQLLKMAVIASVGRLRNMRFVNVVNVSGAEVVVALPVLAISNLIYQDAGSSSLLAQVFLGWVAGAATTMAPYAVYRLARAMVLGQSLVSVLTSGVLLSEVILLLQLGTNSALATGSGLVALSRTIILLGGGAVMAVAQPGEFLMLVSLALIYVSLLIYSLSPREGVSPRHFVTIAGLAVVTTAIAYSGIYASSRLAIPFAIFVSVPASLIASLIWWGTREG